MFTGLVEDLGVVKRIVRKANSAQISISTTLELKEVKIGDSINTNGVCLTLIALSPPYFTVEVSQETLKRTNLLALREGEGVNLERALRVGDRLGGHLVSGHIDGIGIIKAKRKERGFIQMRIAIPAELSKYVVEKGSVAVDGISLTVNECKDSEFSLTIIPYTVQHTTLGFKKVSDKVNIEVDLMGKYVERLLKREGKDAYLQYTRGN